MSELELLERVAAEIMEQHCSPDVVAAAESGLASELWAALETTGLPLVSLPERLGGAGGGWRELAAILRTAGRFAAPIPLAETSALAGWLVAETDLGLPPGPLTIAPVQTGDRLEIVPNGDAWTLRGEARRVPWARQASAIVVLAGGRVALVPPTAGRIAPGLNLAREPRDRVSFDDVPLSRDAVAEVGVDADQLLTRGALARSIQMVGALDRVLELTVAYVQVREQFGRPIGRFQAVQQELARLAGEVQSAAAAVDGAIVASAAGNAEAEIAAAKVRSGAAASEGARIAHQLHGAIGVTHEHQLHQLTTRLWSWREELGGEREWAVRLGRFVAAAGSDGFWDWLAGGRGRTE